MTGNRRGALLMIAAMAGFAVEDMLIKQVSAGMPVGQILMVFGAGGMAVFVLLARQAGQRVLSRDVLTRQMALRAAFELAGRLFYALAITLTPLSSASAILQATPLVVTAGAAVFFGESVGWRRWCAIGAGFAGVMLILRPGTASFAPASVFAVLGTLGFAGRDLATRAAPPQLSNLQLGVWGFAVLVVTGAVLLARSGGAVWPDALASLLLVATVIVGVAGYYGITAAMRVGAVAAVTPFRYARLVFALILGALVFGERPDALTLTGAAIVIGSGLYSLWRDRAG